MIDNKQILYNAIKTYGVDAQLKMAIEEMSELTKEICKNFRGKENKKQIAEEIADVEIMIAQLKIMFGCSVEVMRFKERKMARLAERLETDEHTEKARDTQ